MTTTDLTATAERFWNLETVRSLPCWESTLPTITTRRRKGLATNGLCYVDERRIALTIGTDPAWTERTLLHELVHAALPVGEHHSNRFRSALNAARNEAIQ